MLTEQEFLKDYHIEDYDRPSLTSDIVVLAIRSKKDARQTYRQDEERCLSLLLIRRGGHPFKDHWALPGGFLQRGETLEDCALRETKEETGIQPAALMPIGIFSKPDRDPRGWIISGAFVSILGAEDVRAKGGDDAAEAEWFNIRFERTGDDLYQLVLSHDDIVLKTLLQEKESRFGRTDFMVIGDNELAFDHASIIAGALAALRDKSRDVDILFDFLPETFTINEVQKVQEAISSVAVLPANFRRKISRHIIETDKQTQGAGHRPARLYRRKEA